MFNQQFVERYNIFIKCHKLRNSKQQIWPYCFLDNCSCNLNNSPFLDLLVQGEKHRYNNFSFQRQPPNYQSLTSVCPLKKVQKITATIKEYVNINMTHTQHFVSQMFSALSHTVNQATSRVMWWSLGARSDSTAQAFLHWSSRLNLLPIYANFYLT